MKIYIRKLIDNIKARLPEINIDIRDAHVYGGLSIFGYGLYSAYPPAAFASCGIILFWLGVRK